MIEFFRYLKEVKDEILALKNTASLSAEVLTTKSYTKNFTAKISLGAPGGVYSEKIYILTLKSDRNFLASVYQGGSNFNKRYLDVYRMTSSANQHVYHIKVRSLNNSDISTVQGGGSVNVNFSIKYNTTAEVETVWQEKTAEWWGEI